MIKIERKYEERLLGGKANLLGDDDIVLEKMASLISSNPSQNIEELFGDGLVDFIKDITPNQEVLALKVKELQPYINKGLNERGLEGEVKNVLKTILELGAYEYYFELFYDCISDVLECCIKSKVRNIKLPEKSMSEFLEESINEFLSDTEIDIHEVSLDNFYNTVEESVKIKILDSMNLEDNKNTPITMLEKKHIENTFNVESEIVGKCENYLRDLLFNKDNKLEDDIAEIINTISEEAATEVLAKYKEVVLSNVNILNDNIECWGINGGNTLRTFDDVLDVGLFYYFVELLERHMNVLYHNVLAEYINANNIDIPIIDDYSHDGILFNRHLVDELICLTASYQIEEVVEELSQLGIKVAMKQQQNALMILQSGFKVAEDYITNGKLLCRKVLLDEYMSF